MGSTRFCFLLHQLVKVSKCRIAGVLCGAKFFAEPQFSLFIVCHRQLHALFLAHYLSVYSVLKPYAIEEFVVVCTRNACNKDLIGFVKLCSVVMDQPNSPSLVQPWDLVKYYNSFADMAH